MSESGSLGANLGLNVNRSELEINIGEKRKNEEVKVVETKTEESAFGGRAASQTFQEIQCKKNKQADNF
jgi:predicted dinucleotide-binding enzyme